MKIEKNQVIQIFGAKGEEASYKFAEIAKEKRKSLLILTSSFTKAKKIADNLSFFTDYPVLLCPNEDSFFLKYDAKSRDYLNEKLKILIDLEKETPSIVLASASSALKKMPPLEIFKKNKLIIRKNELHKLDDVKKRLVDIGYENIKPVESLGQFSARGDIIDLFPIGESMPVRVEFFDDIIESIRIYNPESQRSLKEKNEILIHPADLIVYEESFKKKLQGKIKDASILESILEKSNMQILDNYIHYLYDETTNLFSYFPKDSILVLDDPDHIYEKVYLNQEKAFLDFEKLLESATVQKEDFKSFPSIDDYISLLADSEETIYFTSFDVSPNHIKKPSYKEEIKIKGITISDIDRKNPGNYLSKYIDNGYSVTLVSNISDKLQALKSMVASMGLAGLVKVVEGKLVESIEISDKQEVYLRADEILNLATSKKRRRAKKNKKSAPIKSFSDIKNGDYVVHENHGIGRYTGVHKLNLQGVERDYLKIEYAGQDVLYVPVENMDIIQRYIGGGRTPRLLKLSGNEWAKTKEKIERDIEEMAVEMLEISAKRKAKPGYSFEKDSIWQNEFEEMFPFEETEDQLNSIEAVKNDMESPYAMDRLICGDVGYGKTEVAARAVFKAIDNGKQVAFLVPTTILANQHYMTFQERFDKFPFRIEMLSRFRSKLEQARTIEGLKKGSVDVVIGTHRLLSKDLAFKDLGLLIIDEEQRFGVEDKEKLKTLKETVDVLSLSATPIPRTLHMSLTGLRDMSLIEDPPHDRLPVQTYVMEESEDVIREAVMRELDRGGQVFVIYNRIRGINRIKKELEEIVPQAKVAVAHGRVSEAHLEDIMQDFIDKEYDLLLSTTIIEAGIDIPNANTIIILDSDKMGLSQLYQLRGRVGRSNRVAYAYFMYNKIKAVSEVAEKRLKAVKDFTEFGAGFKIAMKDLELRGAGNLLGKQQHGNMSTVGYELYCKMLEDAVKRLKGQDVNENSLEPVIEIKESAFIPEAYIDDELTKLNVYKKISLLDKDDDREELLEELEDRFGRVPFELMNLINVSIIKSLARHLDISKVKETRSDSGSSTFMFEYFEEKSPNIERLSEVSQRYKNKVSIKSSVKPRVFYGPLEKNSCYTSCLGEVIKFMSSLVL